MKTHFCGAGCGSGHSQAAAFAAQAPRPEGQDRDKSDGDVDPLASFYIREMDCPMEEALIRDKLASLPGVTGMRFNLLERTLKVGHKPDALAGIVAALDSLHLGAALLDEAQAQQPEQRPDAPAVPWKRLLAAGAAALAAEIVHFSTDAAWPVLGLAILAIGLGGLTTYKKGWVALKNLNLNMNALMSIAVTGALLIGQWPEAAMVMVLFNLAEAIEALSMNRARQAIDQLLRLAPEEATAQQPDGSWAVLPVASLAVNTVVRVRPGERIALDGEIVSGGSQVNQAPITGESLPVDKTVGDQVYAGTINESGSFEYKVTSLAGNSMLARIIHAVEEAQGSKAPTQRFVDAFAKIYTPVVFGVALLAALLPPVFLGGAWFDWIYNALVILVIACPCALVISTPVSVVSGLAAASRKGILVKGGMFLEQGRKLSVLALDKTGTLTTGRPALTDFINVGALPDKEARLLGLALADRSDHPVSRAIAESGSREAAILPKVLDFEAIPGRGSQGLINGRVWRLGNHALVEELRLCSPALEEKLFALEKQGKSVVVLLHDSGVEALFAVADTIRETSREAVAGLRELGIRPVLLSGDNAHTVAAIAEQAGISEAYGNLLPEDKLAMISRLAREGSIGMVGDGINDAPALARADIGFAMAAMGTDTAIETADVALMDDDLRKLPAFVRLSRSTRRILIQNISFALLVKAAFFGLALAGQATMWMAVFADMGVSLLVVGNGLRLLKK